MATKKWDFLKSGAYCIANATFLLVFAILLGTSGLRAQTPGFDETWINPGTGSWFTAANWVPASVPTTTQSVLVDNGGTAQIGPPQAPAGSLTIGISTPGSTVQLLSGGTLNVTQTVVVGGAGALLSAGGQLFAKALENSGLITNTSGNATSFGSGGSIVNNTTGMILGSNYAIFGNGPLTVTNAGNIEGTVVAINFNSGGGSLLNEAGASITSATFQPVEVAASGGVVNITNSGTIFSSFGGIGYDTGNASGTVTNNAGGIIRGTGANSFGIDSSSTGLVTVINSGTISGQNNGIAFGFAGSVTNNAGGTIQGTGVGSFGIGSFGSAINITNSGTIAGGGSGVILSGGSVTNNSTGLITAPAPTTGAFTLGILVSGGTVNIDNAGLISGENGVVFNGGGTVTNRTGGTIQGVSRNDNGFDSFTGSGIAAFGNSTPVTVVNEAGATIQGLGTFSWGIHTGSTPINITNFGIISGTVNAINVNGGGTFINEAGASITSTTFQPISVTSDGVENIINSGTISSSFGGIGFANGNASGTITNNVGGIIKGTGVNSFGIADGSTNVVNVINSGTISAGGSAIILNGGGSVTNNATGSIIGSPSAPTNGFTAGGVLVSGVAGNVTNSGLISGQCGIVLSNGGTITNNAGGTIQGIGLNENGLNSTTGSGILLAGDSSVTNSITNNVGGIIEGTGTDSWGIKSFLTPANIINFGSISGDLVGINVNGGGTLNNEAGASVTAKTGVAVIMTAPGAETIVNSGTIMSSGSAAVAFRDGGSGSVTNNPGGVLTGTGGVAILSQTPDTTGSINVLNAGTINGAVTLGNASNMVTLVTGGKISGNLSLGSSSGSTLVLDGAGTQAISKAVTGSIQNSGSLTKQGTGTWTLDKGLSAPISTSVLAGVLVVDSTLSTPVVNVHAGATLAGFGTITGSVINSGIVAPGTLQLSGNYTQNSGGTLLIGVAGLASGQHGLLALTGHASLAGTLQLIGLGGFTLHAGDQLTFLTANGGVSGSFATVQNQLATSTLVNSQIVILPNTVLVEGTQGSFLNTPGVATTPNQVAVAKMLDSAAGDPRAAALFAFLDSQPLANLPHDLDLIAPTQIASINATAVSLGNIQMSNLQQQLAAIRGGSTGFSSAGFAISGGAGSFGPGFAGVSGPEGKSGPPVFAPTPENRWGVFLTGLGEFTNVDSTSNAPGYDVNTGGFTLGVDYRLTPNFAIGLTAGYAHTSVGVDSPGGDIDVNAGTIGMYATVFGNGFYLDTALSGGPSGYTTRRTALQGTADGSTSGGDFNFLVAAGYDWKKGNLTIGPTASFQYSYVALDGFTETGSLAPLTFPRQNTESERTAFGAKASYEWKVGHITVLPQVSAAWQHEYGDTAYAVVASLASGAGNSLTVHGPEIGRDSVLVGAGATVILNDRVSTYLYYDGEFARTNYLSNNVTAGVRISF